MNPRIFVASLSLILSVLSADASFDYITVPPGADPSVSAEDGGERRAAEWSGNVAAGVGQ